MVGKEVTEASSSMEPQTPKEASVDQSSTKLTFVELYEREVLAIGERRKMAFAEDFKNPDDSEGCRGAHDTPAEAAQDDSKGPRIESSMVGMALSGGGLRSATFNLGLLQAFRQNGLLRYIDILSSVSGGGYTAGYLAAVAHQTKAYHDSHNDSPAKLSEEDEERFARCGWYLYSPFEFSYEYILSTAALLGTFFCGLMAVAYLIAMLWRWLDFPFFRDWLSIVGLEADLFVAFVPTFFLALLCLTAFLGDKVAYQFRSASFSARFVQGICAALLLISVVVFFVMSLDFDGFEFLLEALFAILSLIFLFALINLVGFALFNRKQSETPSSPRQQYWLSFVIFVFAIGSLPIALAVLIANGDLGLGWVGELVGMSSTTIQKAVREPILFLVAVSFLAMFRYRHLLRSRRPNASTWERYVSKAVLAVIVFGVPILMVGWAAVENGSGFAVNQPTNLRWYHIRNWRAFDDLAESEHFAEDQSRSKLSNWMALFQRPEHVVSTSSKHLLGDVLFKAMQKPVVVKIADSKYSELGIEEPADLETNFRGHLVVAHKIASHFRESNVAQQVSDRPDAYSDLFTEATLAVDNLKSTKENESPSHQDALRASLALERLFESLVHGPEGWIEHDMSLLDRQGLVSRWGMLTYGLIRPNTDKNPAVALIQLRRISRLIEDGICGELNKFQRNGELTSALGNSLQARIEASGDDTEPLAASVEKILDALKTDSPAYKSEVEGLDNVTKDLIRSSDHQTGLATNQTDLKVDRNGGNAYWNERNGPQFDRTMMFALYPDVFKSPQMVSTSVVVSADQAERLEYFAMYGFAFLILLFLLPVNRVSPIYRFYRRKLQGAFLRPLRDKPNDGFDSKGRIPLKTLQGHKNGGPLHLFLAALHLTVDVKPIFDGRKVAANKTSRRHHSLLYSPLANGTVASGFLTHDDFRQRSSRTLDEAVTISGAAVSPMAVADRPLRWVLSALNLRTGQWVRNPRFDNGKDIRAFEIAWEWLKEHIPQQEGLQEDERWRVGSAADGGYHEFLGLSELINRRCRVIIVSDAGTNDSSTEFEVLADAIRIAKHEHNVELLDLDNDEPLCIDRLKRHAPDKYSAQHYIMGRVRYPYDDQLPNSPREGILIYLQMSMTGDEDVDLKQFHKSHDRFPDEPITNQFFDEKLVEAFRSLGHHIGSSLAKNVPNMASREFFSTEQLLDSLIRAYRIQCTREQGVDDGDADGSVVMLPEVSDDAFLDSHLLTESIFDYERDICLRRKIDTDVGSSQRSGLPKEGNVLKQKLLAPWAIAINRSLRCGPNDPPELFQVGGRQRLIRVCAQFLGKIRELEKEVSPDEVKRNDTIKEFFEGVSKGVFRTEGSKTAKVLILRLFKGGNFPQNLELETDLHWLFSSDVGGYSDSAEFKSPTEAPGENDTSA